MNRWFLGLVVAVTLAGCGKEEKRGVNINAPGVNVNVDEKGRTNIEAPGVNVKTNP